MNDSIGLPTKAPVAEAFGLATAPVAADPISGSPLEVLAAALAMPEPDSSSRRDTANAAHAKGTAAGAPPSPPAPSHANKLPLNPDTAPRGDAAVITGTSATASAGAVATDTTAGEGAESPDIAIATGDGTVGDSDDASVAGSTDERGAGTASEDDAGTLGATTAPSDSVRSATTTGLESTPRARVWTAVEARRPTLARGDDDGESLCAAGLSSAPASVSETTPEPRGAAASAASPRATDDRDPFRVALVSGAESDADEASEELEPADPVVSANAIGTDAIADPTPNATANAPTRPT